MQRLKDLFIRSAEVLDRVGHVWPFVILSLVTLVIVGMINPAKFGAYLWIVSKLCAAFVLGYAFDLAAGHGSNPNMLEGIERAMAQSRRGLLIGLTVLAAGLMP